MKLCNYLLLLFITMFVVGSPVIAESEIKLKTKYVYNSVPELFIKSTYKVKCTNQADSYKITSRGSSVGVDLTDWGYKGKGYLLTAAHVVLYDDKTVYDKIEVEVRLYSKNGNSSIKKWVKADVVVAEPTMDIAIIYVSIDLPYRSKMSITDDLNIMDPLIAIGSPLGTGLTPTFGVLVSKEKEVSYQSKFTWQASMPVFFGNSGGPVFDPIRGKVVGIVSAIAGRGNSFAPNVTFYVSHKSIKFFLESGLVKKYINKYSNKKR